ncbi:MAG: hypothetical protein JXA46_10705 [Dehalococcoidales bacterium]|nr:hypothetical protein [Dehalococcoidales bacterium]
MFKVNCRLIEFLGDEKTYPCHFEYRIGDEIVYDGDRFIGRVCPGIMATMMPVVHGLFLVGHKYTENIFYRYRGRDVRDPAGGYRPLALPPEKTYDIGGHSAVDARSGKARGGHFLCGDNRILAHFACEAVDISDSAYAQPFYRREIAVLDKVIAEPGIRTDKILDKFSQSEKQEISPPLTPVLLKVLLEALEDMNYLEVRDGCVWATGRQPPSQIKK